MFPLRVLRPRVMSILPIGCNFSRHVCEILLICTSARLWREINREEEEESEPGSRRSLNTQLSTLNYA
jgi:hypothetical protein